MESMKYDNLRNLENYRVIINEEDSIWLKNHETGEMIAFNHEHILNFKDVKSKFGDVPSIKYMGKFFVLNLKIKKMELVLDCSIKKISELKDNSKKAAILAIAEKSGLKIDQDEPVIIMSISHRNLENPIYLDVREFQSKNPDKKCSTVRKNIEGQMLTFVETVASKELVEAMDFLQKTREGISSFVRATKYKPQAVEGSAARMKGRSKLTKSWAA